MYIEKKSLLKACKTSTSKPPEYLPVHVAEETKTLPDKDAERLSLLLSVTHDFGLNGRKIRQGLLKFITIN